MKKPVHLIFEGADLAGKSWIMSRVYNYLEPRGKRSAHVLDGCRWFNCDNGVFGTAAAPAAIAGYLKIFAAVKGSNIIVEKFHWSDQAYDALFGGKVPDYRQTEKKLRDFDFRVVLVKLPADRAEINKRLADRLKLYPHYIRVARTAASYLKQQAELLKIAARSKLDHLAVDTVRLPDQRVVDKITRWIENDYG